MLALLHSWNRTGKRCMVLPGRAATSRLPYIQQGRVIPLCVLCPPAGD